MTTTGALGTRTTGSVELAEQRWSDALLAAALCAVDPHALGGVRLVASAGPVRDTWLAQLQQWWRLAPVSRPWRKLPTHVSDDRLLGGVDLTATLDAGRLVSQKGLLAEADGGLVVVPMAERMSATVAAHLGAALDRGELQVARDGWVGAVPARIGVLAFDEAGDDDTPMPMGLADRLGPWVHLEGLPARVVTQGISSVLPGDAQAIEAAQAHLHAVVVAAPIREALVTAAVALGVESLRPVWLAEAVARAHAAWQGRDEVDADDAAVAVRLVLAPRATRLPQMSEPPDAPASEVEEEAEPPSSDAAADPAPPAEAAPTSDSDAANPPPADDGDPAADPMPDQLLAAAAAAIPPGLLARLALQMRGAAGPRGAGMGRSGAVRAGLRRGRPAGVRPGLPVRGARLSLVDTLRAAAPWQRVRARDAVDPPNGRMAGEQVHPLRVHVRTEDFRIRRQLERRETTAVFVVDASGSAALQRLAEAKGAVELLLAECYVRRDRVALVSFRGAGAELLLPPTRSLVRAKRALAGLPGGGGTPLATGLDLAYTLVEGIRRRGDTPLTVLLTDGRANVSRDGRAGRETAHADAMLAAQRFRALGAAALVIDLSRQPYPAAAQIAQGMAGVYLPLPQADAQRLASAVSGAWVGLRRQPGPL